MGPTASTSDVEVTNIDSHGLWLYVRGQEYFLPYQDYPWFEDAKVRDILNVARLHEQHLHWPSLDVDLCVQSLRSPDEFPLSYE